MTVTGGFVARGRLARPPLPPAPVMDVLVQDSFPLMDRGVALGWQARAREMVPTDAPWSLRVFAICADRP